MERFVAFLRGMNLGGRRITNDDLRAQFEAIGLAQVATFRASGNVVFAAAGEAEAALVARVEAELGERLGYEVPVFLRSGAEVAAIAAHEPFSAADVAASKGKLQVQLLAAEPDAAAREAALVHSSGEDRLAIAGRELYWLPSGGISESDLDLKAIARALGPGTVRTMGTIQQLAARI
jgi:uncharacterized protein (DUF1697 family)